MIGRLSEVTQLDKEIIIREAITAISAYCFYEYIVSLQISMESL